MNNHNHAWKVEGRKYLREGTRKKSSSIRNGTTVILKGLTSDLVS